MNRRRSWSSSLTLLTCCFLWATWAASAPAYITIPVQTLGQLCPATPYITLVRVEKVSKEKGIIIYRKVQDLKNKYPSDVITHVFDLKNTPAHKGGEPVQVRPDETDWKHAIDWAEPGKMAVVFSCNRHTGHFGHTYIDGLWYATECPKRDWLFWYAIYSDPALLSRWHCGTPSQLAAAVEKMLAGKEAVLPVMVEGTKQDLRLGRAKIKGLRVGLNIQDYNAQRDLVASWVDKETVPSLIKSLQDAKRDSRANAVRELGLIGPEAKEAVPSLVALSEDKDDEVREAALIALANIGAEAKTALPAFLSALKDGKPIVRQSAVRGVGKLGTHAKAALPELTILLPKSEGIDRLEIAEALVRIDPENKLPVALTVTANLLEDRNVEKATRLRAAEVLKLFGPTAQATVPALSKTMKDPDEDIRIKTAEVLTQLGPTAKNAVAALAEAVGNDSSGTVRMRAADALAAIGAEARTARAALEAALSDPRIAQRPEVLAKIKEAHQKLK